MRGADYRTKTFYRQRERQRLGSHGAASDVRHIDPATYQQPEAESHGAISPRENKTRALLNAADSILLKDARRRHGKRFAKRARNLIVTGRYR